MLKKIMLKKIVLKKNNIKKKIILKKIILKKYNVIKRKYYNVFKIIINSIKKIVL